MSVPFQEIPATLRAALADRYSLEREIGRGGMATVYLARDLKHERPVAVKVLSPVLAGAAIVQISFQTFASSRILFFILE